MLAKLKRRPYSWMILKLEPCGVPDLLFLLLRCNCWILAKHNGVEFRTAKDKSKIYTQNNQIHLRRSGPSCLKYDWRWPVSLPWKRISFDPNQWLALTILRKTGLWPLCHAPTYSAVLSMFLCFHRWTRSGVVLRFEMYGWSKWCSVSTRGKLQIKLPAVKLLSFITVFSSCKMGMK